ASLVADPLAALHAPRAPLAVAPGCAVELTRRVDKQPGFAIGPPQRKAVQHMFCPGAIGVGRQLEDRAVSDSAAIIGRAVKISHRVEDKVASGPVSVGSVISERMENTGGPVSVPVRAQSKNGPIVVSTTARRCAVKIHS